MFVGTFGSVIFTTSRWRTLTFNGLSTTAGANYANHDLLTGKPRKQFIGAHAQGVQLDIMARSDLGTSPRLLIQKLRKMAETGEAHRLIIGGVPVTGLPLVITSMSDSWDTIYNGGQLFQASISLTLEEYR